MPLTLNQILKRIETLALSHDQINSFYFGGKEEFDVNGDIDYPACFCEEMPGSIDRAAHLQIFNFRIYLLDRVLVSENTEGNETEVLSDMASVAADIMAMLMSYEYQDEWVISDVANRTSVTEELGDMVAGSIIEVGVGVEFIADRCSVPASDVTFENDFDMARTRILPYTGTGSEGDGFTVPLLAGKIVLAAYRATDYKRVVTITPDSTDKIKVTGTDLGDRKGVLSSDGSVELVSGDGLLSGEILDFLIIE
jgi:hypothetical protein